MGTVVYAAVYTWSSLHLHVLQFVDARYNKDATSTTRECCSEVFTQLCPCIFFTQHIKRTRLIRRGLCGHLKQNLPVTHVRGTWIIFAYGSWTDPSCLISALSACCALLSVSGTVSRAQRGPLATLLPISLFTALEKKTWLYCTISPDFVYVRDFTQTHKLFMLGWMSFSG